MDMVCVMKNIPVGHVVTGLINKERTIISNNAAKRSVQYSFILFRDKRYCIARLVPLI